MKKKKTNANAAVVTGVVILVAIGGVFAMGQDWKTGENAIIQMAQAQLGDPEALYQQGLKAQAAKGFGDARGKAIALFEKAAARGHVKAMLALGDIYNADNSTAAGDKAVHWYEKASAAGNVEAMRKLGLCYQMGRGRIDPDPDKAIHAFEQAAAKGDAASEYLLGKLYLGGFYTDKAVFWLEKAASHGQTAAWYDLGNRYYYGGDTSDNVAKAFHYYGLASEANNWEAQLVYSFMYFSGKGTHKDLAEAYKWVLIATDSQQSKATDALDFLRLQIKPADVTEGNARATAWRKARKAAQVQHAICPPQNCDKTL